MIILVVGEKINKSNSFTSILFISNFESMDFYQNRDIYHKSLFCTNLGNNFLFGFSKILLVFISFYLVL